MKKNSFSQQNGFNFGNVSKDIGRYADMSEQSLVNELLKQFTIAKSSGNISADDLNNFYNTVAPSLDDTQKSNLNMLINSLKNSL